VALALAKYYDEAEQFFQERLEIRLIIEEIITSATITSVRWIKCL
jgi:hypothetical protein